ncbi:CCNY [Symbiodinium microadriaticum]|nr:CCNY [Symbiodinium microadriaticum]
MTWDDEDIIGNASTKDAEEVVVTPFTVSKCVAIMIRDEIFAAAQRCATDSDGNDGAPLIGTNPVSSSDCSVRTALEKLTQLENMTEFVHKVCYQSQMEYECMVAAVIYMQRLLSAAEGRLQLSTQNWKAISLSCIILASKVFDDFHMLNADYCSIFPGLLVGRIDELEVALLEALDHKLWISQRQYAEMHFQLQEMIAKGVIKQVKLSNSVVSAACSTVNSGKSERASIIVTTRNSRIVDLVNRHRGQQLVADNDGEDGSSEGGPRSRGSSSATYAARSRNMSDDILPRGRVYSTECGGVVVLGPPCVASVHSDKARSRSASEDVYARGRGYSAGNASVVVGSALGNSGRSSMCESPPATVTPYWPLPSASYAANCNSLDACAAAGNGSSVKPQQLQALGECYDRELTLEPALDVNLSTLPFGPHSSLPAEGGDASLPRQRHAQVHTHAHRLGQEQVEEVCLCVCLPLCRRRRVVRVSPTFGHI